MASRKAAYLQVFTFISLEWVPYSNEMNTYVAFMNLTSENNFRSMERYVNKNIIPVLLAITEKEKEKGIT